MSRRVVALVFGGRSVEHEVSLVSARGIFDNLDRARNEVVLVGVDREGRPRVGGEELLAGGLDRGEGTVARWPSHRGDRALREETTGRALTPPLDAVFPIVHGSGGEDGTLQGVLTLAGIPCVGAGVLGSSLAMDKDRTRRVLAQAGIPVVRDAVFEGPEAGDARRVLAAAEVLGWPLFVKPARAGSSVGITKVKDAAALDGAVAAARAVDPKIVLEEAIPGAREVEVAVLGLWRPEASVVGEIVPGAEFYDYDAKYHDADSQLLVPAPLEPALADALRAHAVRAFRELDLAGLARVDFLLSRETGRLVLNEVNTLPGFTPISMYPRLWEASGVPYRELLERLVAIALEAAAAHPLAMPGAARRR